MRSCWGPQFLEGGPAAEVYQLREKLDFVVFSWSLLLKTEEFCNLNTEESDNGHSCMVCAYPSG